MLGVNFFMKVYSAANRKTINFGTSLKGFPASVGIAINKNCNLKCSYCPNKFIEKYPPEQVMPIPFYKKILNDLKEIDFDGLLYFSRFNEPTLVKVEKYIKLAKEKLPKARTELYTNASIIDSKRLKSLKDSGIDLIIATQHTAKGFIDRLKNIPDELLKNVHVHYGDEMRLVNRAGVLNSIEEPLNKPCYSVSRVFVVDTDGKVPICIDDYQPSVILGDLHDKSVKEIWTDPYYENLRHQIGEVGNREILDLCKKCDRTPEHRLATNFNLNMNEASYRKKLLQETGNAHIGLEKLTNLDVK